MNTALPYDPRLDGLPDRAGEYYVRDMCKCCNKPVTSLDESTLSDGRWLHSHCAAAGHCRKG